MIRGYFSKITEPVVAEFLSSMICTDLRIELFEKHHIANDKLKSFFLLLVDLAQNKIPFSSIPQEASRLFAFDESAALSFARDLLGTHFLFLADYFPDMLTSLESFGGKPENYIEVIGRISKALAEEKAYFAKEIAPDEEYVFQPKPIIEEGEEGENLDDEPLSQEEYASLFNKGVISFLFEMSDPEMIREFNQETIVFISENSLAQNDFFKNLMSNQEMIGRNPIWLENKKVDPTIANWLKDFIKEKGSDFFDELILAEYLAVSPNPKNLSSDEKNLLRRLLNLYRNLAFFPESQENLPAEKWQLVPFEEKDQQEKTFLEKKEDNFRRELEESLRKFQKGSLEYRAASEELERLNKTLNKN